MTPKTSHSWDVLGQRFALDFVQADAAFARHRGRGTHPGDDDCYDAPILAAADGIVVAVEQRIGLAPLLGWGVCDFTARSFIGNHVLIEHAEGEYALYAHLVKDSATVRPGDRVLHGQTIGRCGHTGHSTEPHLHFHLQDSADLFAHGPAGGVHGAGRRRPAGWRSVPDRRAPRARAAAGRTRDHAIGPRVRTPASIAHRGRWRRSTQARSRHDAPCFRQGPLIGCGCVHATRSAIGRIADPRHERMPSSTFRPCFARLRVRAPRRGFGGHCTVQA
jgi:hypothetical protein